MSKYKTTIIAVVALIIAVVALVVALKLKGDDNKPVETPVNYSSGTKLFDFDKSLVAKFFSSFNELYTVTKTEEADDEKDASWSCESHDDVKVEDSTVNKLVEQMTDVSGEVIENVEDTSQYGFIDNKSDVYVTFVLQDGSSHTLYVGNPDISGSYYYMLRDDKPTVIYKVRQTYAKDFMIQKEDLINLKIFSFSLEDERKEFLVYKEGELAFEATSSSVDGEGATIWNVKEPAVRDAMNSTLNERIEMMRNLTLNGLADEKCTELAKYGLDKPTIEYRFTVLQDGERVEFRIALGDKTADGEYYYCIIDDTGDVYTISTSYIYGEFNPMAFMDTYVFMRDTDEIKELNLTMGDKSYKFTYEYENPGDTVETLKIDRFFNGKNVPDNDEYSIVTSDSSFRVVGPDEKLDWGVTSSNPRDCFQHVFLSLYAITYTKFDFDVPENPGKVLLRAEYTLTDGSVMTIEYLERDSTTAYVYINGEYADGYCETTSFYGDDFDRADVAAALKALETVMKIVP